MGLFTRNGYGEKIKIKNIIVDRTSDTGIIELETLQASKLNVEWLERENVSSKSIEVGAHVGFIGFPWQIHHKTKENDILGNSEKVFQHTCVL
jgi:hypothetical protein